MATARKRQPPLHGTTSERSKTPTSNSQRENTAVVEVYSKHDSAHRHSNQEKIPSTLRPPIDCTERFGKDFIDPLFPISSVSYAFSKRIFDILFASLFLLIFSWLYLILAIGVRLTSRGPILFKQIRVGKGGRYFHCYKFRSMCVDAEARRGELLHLNEASGPVFKIKQDPRITPFGAFMRKFSMDELPQFVNVLKGDMSIVGPRPPITSEVEMYSPHDRRRLSIQPGLTCTWQVSGRSNLSFERWVELDLAYIDSMSFLGDLLIVIKTVPAVLTGSGAH